MGPAVFLRVANGAGFDAVVAFATLHLIVECASCATKNQSRDGMRHVGLEVLLGRDSPFAAGLRTPPTSSHPMVG